MDRPSLRQLEYFVVLAEELSFRRAAERCFVSQPGLSTQIRQLEEGLGVDLFERSRKQVFLTEAGRELLPEARKALGVVDDLLDRVRSIRDPFSGPLRLGVIPTIAPFLLSMCLQRVRERFPDLQVQLREGQTHDLISRLWKNDLELLLLAREAEIGKVAELPLLKDEFLLGLPASHRLAKAKRVGVEDLARETVLHLEEGHCLGDQARTVCAIQGRERHLDVSGSSLNTIVQMVRCGRGLTLLPQMACQSNFLPTEIKLKQFKKPRPYRTIILAWRPNSPRANVYSEIGQFFREEIHGAAPDWEVVEVIEAKE